MSTVGNVTLMTPSSSTSSTTNPNSTLTQADFLQLMVAQFQASDPLADDSGSGGGSSDSGTADYVNQLMSMTNLTTMQTMSAQQGLQLAQTLPGAMVTLTTPENTTVSGTVTGTSISNGTVNVTINGESYPSSEITALTPASSTAATTNTSSN